MTLVNVWITEWLTDTVKLLVLLTLPLHRDVMMSLGDSSVQIQTKVLPQDSWTKVSCPCCVSKQVESLVLIQLSDNVQPVTKRWLISLIEASKRHGGKRSYRVIGRAEV